MKKILSPAQMGAADQAAIESGVPSKELMMRAGTALGRTALQMMAGGYGRRVVVVCGKGNNGGDGFVCAAHLSRHGVACSVITMAAPESLTGDAAWAFSLLSSTPCRVGDSAGLRAALGRADLAVDAMLGTGFKGELTGRMADAVGLLNSAGVPVLAVDIPSGVDGSTGAIRGPAVRAGTTVTMGALKTGLVQLPGAEAAGDVKVVDIGIPDELVQTRLHLVSEHDLRRALVVRGAASHKRSAGKVVIAAGAVGMIGAASLSAIGAMRAGAGLIRLVVPDSIRPQVAPTVIEVLTSGVAESPEGQFAPEAAEEVAAWANSWDALALGPGIGRTSEVRRFVEKVLEKTTVPVILDADGIAAFAGRPESLRSRDAATILTPHAGELAALMSIEAADVESNRVEIAAEAAKATGGIVLLKGFRTVVAAPSGDAVLVDAGGPILATAGTGDVLTGVLAAFAARTEPFQAAWSGACLHGLAGEWLAGQIGTESMVAGDLSWALANVMGRLQQ